MCKYLVIILYFDIGRFNEQLANITPDSTPFLIADSSNVEKMEIVCWKIVDFVDFYNFIGVPHPLLEENSSSSDAFTEDELNSSSSDAFVEDGVSSHSRSDTIVDTSLVMVLVLFKPVGRKKKHQILPAIAPLSDLENSIKVLKRGKSDAVFDPLNDVVIVTDPLAKSIIGKEMFGRNCKIRYKYHNRNKQPCCRACSAFQRYKSMI